MIIAHLIKLKKNIYVLQFEPIPKSFVHVISGGLARFSAWLMENGPA